MAQRVEIVGVLVADRDRHHARRHHDAIGVRDEQRVARAGQRRRDHVRHAEANRAFTQHDQATGRC